MWAESRNASVKHRQRFTRINICLNNSRHESCFPTADFNIVQEDNLLKSPCFINSSLIAYSLASHWSVFNNGGKGVLVGSVILLLVLNLTGSCMWSSEIFGARFPVFGLFVANGQPNKRLRKVMSEMKMRAWPSKRLNKSKRRHKSD